MPASSQSRRVAADLALVGIATVWGATFPIAKVILEHLPPFTYIAWRFGLAFVLFLPFVIRKLPRGGTALAWTGAVGAAIAAGFLLQTLGLRTAGATVSAFLTALAVVLVPLFGSFWGRRPTRLEWVGVASSFLGLGLLTIRGWVRPGPSELLLVGCAVCFAWHILFTDRATRQVGPVTLGASQSFVIAAVAALLATSETTTAAEPAAIWWAVVGMAVLASAGALAVMAWAQRHTHPTHVGLCLAFEPVAAAVFAYWWLDETLDGRQWLGVGLILIGIVVSEIRPREPVASP